MTGVEVFNEVLKIIVHGILPLLSGSLCLADTFLIRGARVFDGQESQGIRDVLIESGKIAAVAPKIKTRSGAIVVDGHGSTLLPGLFDSHAHVDDGGYCLRMSALFGVTTVIDLFTAGPGNTPREIHARIRAMPPGEASDFLTAGLCVTVKGGHGTQFGIPIPTLDDPAEAQAFVDARIAEGSDLIKIIYENFGGKVPRLHKASMERVVEAAHARGKLAVVHAGEGPDSIRDALDAGADGVAHSFVNGVADADYGRMFVSHGAFIIPTLTEMVNLCGLPDNAALGRDPRVTPWLPEAEAGRLKKSVGKPKHHYDCVGSFASIPLLVDAGVMVLAGTDAGNPGVSHGASLHEELELLVRCGLSPKQALVAATSAPARVWGLRDRGRIAPGFRADLLLVDGDPTEDITATRKINRVWLAGVLVNRNKLLQTAKSLQPK
ncbi:MAG: amidohydrolase family protein [Acidobacteriota bacterium]|nr:amidohydrolase family protein [Acidobacteriota bacterium]